jgi:hypothetical protein
MKPETPPGLGERPYRLHNETYEATLRRRLNRAAVVKVPASPVPLPMDMARFLELEKPRAQVVATPPRGSRVAATPEERAIAIYGPLWLSQPALA